MMDLEQISALRRARTREPATGEQDRVLASRQARGSMARSGLGDELDDHNQTIKIRKLNLDDRQQN